MRQVVQSYRGGTLDALDVPVPAVRPGTLLVQTAASLISSGTERSTVQMAKKSLLGKAIARPDLVRKVVATARRDGLRQTAQIVRGRLGDVAELGYSAAGHVVAVGSGVQGWKVGDRVACAGQNYAGHAELNCVPERLCVQVPVGVSLDEACYVALGAIALQSVRQAEPDLGAVVGLIGLGLVGQLTCQLLVANGCRVIAADLSADRCATAAKQIGVDAAPDDFVQRATQATAGHGLDAVIVAASTPSSAPVALAVDALRKRGRLIVLGDVGMALEREPMYRKEIELRLSTSYGPGRYDPLYEEAGQDYPLPYVRWTEQRNMQAFLDLIAAERLDVERLTTEVVRLDEIAPAYERLRSGDSGTLGVVIRYQDEDRVSASDSRSAAAVSNVDASARIWLCEDDQRKVQGLEHRLRLGIIGAGGHARDKLLPRLVADTSVALRAVCGRSGARSRNVAQRYEADYCTTDTAAVLSDSAVDAVLIGTRHDSHAALIVAALDAGKRVFCEKPMCLSEEELADIQHAIETSNGALFMGFNRRFSSHTTRARAFIGEGAPKTMVYRVNAGALGESHWLNDPSIGGGRLVGEGCHFVDLMANVCGAAPVSVDAIALPGATSESFVLSIAFADDSVGSLVYTAVGASALQKEYFEIHSQEKSVVIDDFTETRMYGSGRPDSYRSRSRDMGFDAQMRSFLSFAQAESSVARHNAIEIAVSRTTLRAVASLRSASRIGV